MDFTKPDSIEQFESFLSREFGYINDYLDYYEVATKYLKESFENSAFWKSVEDLIGTFDDEYMILKKTALFSERKAPHIYIKSLQSLINKAFRKDVLQNPNYPDAPDNGWIHQSNWFETVGDILRTTMVVRYFDGVEFVMNKLSELAASHSLQFDKSFEAKEQGYYAVHTGVRIPLKTIDNHFQPIEVDMHVEIQITTQLQSEIKELLHLYYERDRLKVEPVCSEAERKWQWDNECEEFNVNYLGHTTHFLEGLIVSMRDKQNQ